jgi:hypothetical protein
MSNNSYIVACIFAAVTFLPSRYLETIRGFLPNCCLATGDIHTGTQTDGRDLRSRWAQLTLYTPSFIRTCSGIPNSWGGDTKTYRQHGDCISLLHFLLSGQTAKHGGKRFLLNVCNHLPNSTAPHPRDTI